MMALGSSVSSVILAGARLRGLRDAPVWVSSLTHFLSLSCCHNPPRS